MVAWVLLPWLSLFFAARAARSICLGLLSARLLSTLPLSTLTASRAVCTICALLTAGAIAAFRAVIIFSTVCACVFGPVAIATGCGLSSTLALLLAGLLAPRLLLLVGLRLFRRLFVARLNRGAVGIYRCRFLPALLPISALALWCAGIRLVSVPVVVVVIQKLVNSMRCCARDNFAIDRALLADDAMESLLIARLAPASLGPVLADQVSLIRISNCP